MGVDSDIVDLVERDIDFSREQITATLVWGSQTINGTKGAELETHVVEPEGEYIQNEITFVAKLSDFTSSTLPDQRTVVTLDSVKHYVLDATQNGAHAVITLRRGT